MHTQQYQTHLELVSWNSIDLLGILICFFAPSSQRLTRSFLLPLLSFSYFCLIRTHIIGRALSDSIRHDYPTKASYETALAAVEHLNRENWARGCLRVEKIKTLQPVGRSVSETLHYRVERLEDIQPGSFKLDDEDGVTYLTADFMEALDEFIKARNRASKQVN